MTSQNNWNTPKILTDGQLLIAQNSGRAAAATLTAGSANVTITNGSGTSTVTTNTNATNWVLISTSTASASATIDFTGLSSTYRTYKIEIVDVQPATDGVSLNMRTSTDNGSSFDSGASDYQWGQMICSTSSVSANVNTADSWIELTDTNLGTGTNETCSISLTLYDPSATKYTKATWSVTYLNSSSATRESINAGGYRQGTTAVNAIRFLMSSGNIASGTFSLYGTTA